MECYFSKWQIWRKTPTNSWTSSAATLLTSLLWQQRNGSICLLETICSPIPTSKCLLITNILFQSKTLTKTLNCWISWNMHLENGNHSIPPMWLFHLEPGSATMSPKQGSYTSMRGKTTMQENSAQTIWPKTWTREQFSSESTPRESTQRKTWRYLWGSMTRRTPCNVTPSRPSARVGICWRMQQKQLLSDVWMARSSTEKWSRRGRYWSTSAWPTTRFLCLSGVILKPKRERIL